MEKGKQHALRQKLDLMVLSMWVLTPWAMVFSKAALSIIVALLAVGIIIKVSSPSETVEGSKYHPYFMLLALVVVSGFWTHNTGHWIHLINVSMPLLVYPISYGQNKLLLSRNRNLVFHQFLWASLTLALYIVGLFIFKNEEIIELIKSGGSIALPNNHIRTSLIIAVTAIWSIHQWMTGEESSIRPWIYGLAAVVVFLELHFIAVRSGIVIGYFGLFVYLWRQWKHWRSNRLTVMLSLILAVGISMIYFPFLQAKWQYWIEDIQNMDGFAWNYYSDAVRFKTMAMGIEIGQEHPIFGIGLGDVLDEMTLKFQIQDNIVLSKVIHNMFITWWAGSGFIGLGIALYALYIIGQRQRKKAMEWTVFWMIMVSCLVENTLQVYVGETLFVLFTVFSTDY